jgi:hypothetical protein
VSATRVGKLRISLPRIVRNSRAAVAATCFINNTSAAGNRDFNIIITGAILVWAFQILISSWERFRSQLLCIID